MPDVTDPRQLMEAFQAFEAAFRQLETSHESVHKQLERLQNEFQAVLEAVPFGIWVLDETGKVRLKNKEEDWPGTFTDDSKPWEPSAADGIRRFRDAEGMDHFFEQESRPTDNGKIVILRDVTEQHLRAQQDSRENRLQAMGMMAAELAHEIRNPLGSLALFAGMLVEDLQDSPDTLELARKIQDGTQRLNTLVANILTFSRDLAPKPTIVPLKSFWEEAKKAAGVPDSCEWRNKVPASAAWNADPDMLRQVAVNLLQNSMRAMEDTQKPKLALIATKENIESKPHWHFALSDNGCGIPKESLPRIFDPFYSTFGAGTGLGLAVSHRIITAHNGLMHVESEEGKGTTIRLRLRAGE